MLADFARRARGDTVFFILSRDLGHISADEFDGLNGRCDSVGQLINALGRSLKNRLSATKT